MRRYFAGFKFLILKFVFVFPSQTIRTISLKYLFGMKVASGVTIYGGSEFRAPANITIGRNSIVGNACLMDGRREIEIGANVNISSGVWIWSLHHDVQSHDFSVVGGKVTIEDRVWLCSRSTILPGVEIGEGAVVASGAVVTKNVPPYTIVGGVPAKVIGKRTENLNYELGGGVPFI